MKQNSGWIFGVSSKHQVLEKKTEIENKLPLNYSISINSNILIYFASNPNTYYNPENKWIVNGVGISTAGSKHKLMQYEDWKLYFENPDSVRATGHFLTIKWTDEKIIIQNDFTGLKTIYLIKDKDEIYFCTDIKLILKFIASPELDFNSFGSKWLLFNQLECKSFIKNVFKLKPKSKLIIEGDNHKVESVEQEYLKSAFTKPDFCDELIKILEIEIPSTYKLSFGLSGGLDSRLLLALLYKHRNEFYTHSFGFDYEPDVQIANKLTSSLRIEHKLLLTDLSDENLIKSLPDFIAGNELVEPASTYLRLYKLNDDYFNDKIVIDGANGEIYRRQFLNRLYFAGKEVFINKNINKIFKALSFIRADIFNDDIYTVLINGAKSDIEQQIDAMPDVNSFGFENYLDLFNIKTRFVNYFGPEQMRLDSFLISFMPYINNKLLSSIFSLALKEKKNSKLFVDILRQSDKIFRSTPLVKGNITYPFGMSKYQAMLYTKIKSRIINAPQTNPAIQFYIYNQEQVQQLLLDNSTLNYKLYNNQKVIAIVDGFYSGNKKLVTDLDWLYSFEIFRRKLKLS